MTNLTYTSITWFNYILIRVLLVVITKIVLYWLVIRLLLVFFLYLYPPPYGTTIQSRAWQMHARFLWHDRIKLFFSWVTISVKTCAWSQFLWAFCCYHCELRSCLRARARQNFRDAVSILKIEFLFYINWLFRMEIR